MSAREKYRRPSVFAIFLGMLVSLVYQATHIHPRAPQFHKPDLSRLPWLQKVLGFLGPPAAAAARLARIAWGKAAAKLPRVKLPVLKKPAVKIPRPSVPAALKDAAGKARTDVSVYAGVFAQKCRDIDCQVRKRRRMFLIPAILMGIGIGLFIALPGLVPAAVNKVRDGSQVLLAKTEALLAPDVIYKVNEPSPPGRLDPQQAGFQNEIGHLQLIYEGLTRFNARMETVPAAAEEWSYSLDGLQVTFTLREGLTYSDGTPLNAKRFEYAMLRALDPRSGGEYGALLDGVVGAKALRTAGPATAPEMLDGLREQVQIKARALDGSACTAYEQPECRKLIVALNAPDYAFHTRAASWITYPVKEESIGAGEWSLNKSAHVGNGPFALTALDFSGHSDFAPNPRYWGAQPGYRLEVYYVADPAQALEQYRAGGLDILRVSGPELGAVLADTTLTRDLRRQSGACTYAVTMDPTAAPFDDIHVRAAFAQSVNRAAFVREVQGGEGAPTLTWVPPGLPGHDERETRWDYNPDQARQALAESKYHDAAGLPAITVQYADTLSNNARWNWLRDRWKDVLGVAVILSPQPVGAPYTSPLKIMGWCGDYPDAGNAVEFFHSAGLAADFHYSNPQVDALIQSARNEPDPAARLSLYQQAHSAVLADAPLIALYHNQTDTLFRADLLPNGTPFDALFPVDVDPAAFVTVQQVQYLPMVGR